MGNDGAGEELRPWEETGTGRQYCHVVLECLGADMHCHVVLECLYIGRRHALPGSVGVPRSPTCTARECWSA